MWSENVGVFSHPVAKLSTLLLFIDHLIKFSHVTADLAAAANYLQISTKERKKKEGRERR